MIRFSELEAVKDAVRENRPLVHCITNPISVTRCADAVLAVGARPIMAEHPLEVAEITETAQALLCNLGNITDVRMQAMKNSAQAAKNSQIPLVLDLVGVACSSLRMCFAEELVQAYSPAVLKGNYSEIYAFWDKTHRAVGVDAAENLSMEQVTDSAVQLARHYRTTVLASGKTDIVTDGKCVLYVHNGTPRLAQITGTGCMLGALCACYTTAADAFTASALASFMLSVSGEKAAKAGAGFSARLLEVLLKGEILEKDLKTEVKNIAHI